MQEIQRSFVLNLVQADFHNFHLNLVQIQCGHIENEITHQLYLRGENPISLTQTTKPGIPKSNEFLHRHSTSHELTIFFVTSVTNLQYLNLQKGMESHLVFNIIFNWDPILMERGQSILWHKKFDALKFKVEILPTKRDVILRSVCFYCDHGQPLMVKLGCLKESAAETHPSISPFQDYTSNFHGRRLRVRAGLGIPTLHRFITHSNGTVVPLAGLQVPVLFLLEGKLNFTTNMTLDKDFGKGERDGTYSGLIGKVHSGETELGLAAVLSADRFPAVEYTNPNLFQTAMFSTMLPASGLRYTAVFESLSGWAWALLLTICAALIMPLYVAISLVHGAGNLTALEASYRCFDFLYRTTLEQGVADHQLSYKPSGRILLVFWMFSSLIVGNVYRTRLTSVMVSPLHETLPNNFEELAESNYKIYVQYTGGAFTNSLKNTPSATFQKISQRMILEKSIHQCIQFSLIPNTACIAYRVSLNGVGNKNFTDREGNRLYRTAPGTAFFLPVSPIVPKGAVYKEAIHRVVSQIVDTGLSKRAQDAEIRSSWIQGRKWAARSGDGHKAADNALDGRLKMAHLLGAFLLLLICIITACGILALEIAAATCNAWCYNTYQASKVEFSALDDNVVQTCG